MSKGSALPRVGALVTMLLIGVMLVACAGPAPTKSASSGAPAAETAAVKKPLDLKIGESADYADTGKVTLVAFAPGPKDYSGKPTVKLTVRYENTGKEAMSFNEWDWKLEDANGSRKADTAILDSSPKTLGSGELAPGGKTEGDMYFSQESETTKVIFQLNMFSGEEGLASWLVK